MKKVMFTAGEIDRHKSDRRDWHNFVRRREAEISFSLFPDRIFPLALELGAGDGGQSLTISKYCRKLVCTEVDEKSYAWLGQSLLERQVENVEYQLCDAQDLSRFEDGSFDLIFTSNMLEHVPDVDRCLRECRRVLRDGGVMLHTMPSRWWKVFSAGLTLLKFRRPEVHGVSKSHAEEFRVFGKEAWRERIDGLGLQVTEIVGMPFYVGHGPSFIPITKAGNALGLSASYLYVVKKRRSMRRGER